jgi:TonB family protein
MVYVAGVLLFAARLLLGLFMTRRLLRGARPIDAGADAGVEESGQVRVPLTIGLKHMRILLPGDWREWPAEKLKVVLAHESAHARRYDPAISLLAAANKCVFWFHPLAWWLERRLAVLAEHIADDAALAVSADSGTYARVLLEVAARMEGQNTRLIWNASAMNGQLVARRIRRVMDPCTRRGGSVRRLILLPGAALLLWISISVDLQRMARAQAKPSTQEAEASSWLGFRGDGLRSDSTTAEQAAQLEQQLAADPEDEATRSKLLRYYWQNNMRDRRVSLVLWLIDHHPESALHGDAVAAVFRGKRDGGYEDTFEDVRSRWLTQVDLHPDDIRVLGNAARALGEGSVAEEIGLLKRAQRLDPARATEPLARLYARVLFNSERFAAPLAAQIENELRESKDSALVGKVARHFVDQATMGTLTGPGRWDFAALRTMATGLVMHAQALEPQNRNWADLMEGVKGLPSGAEHLAAAPQVESAPPDTQVVRIGAGVAAGMLLQSSPPVYPPLAKMARIQGVVKLQVHIGADGRVTQTTVVSGHPLLVPAAIDAVKRYLYKPVTMQGAAVEAITTVEVPFDPGKE